jgi:hypothetical protein
MLLLCFNREVQFLFAYPIFQYCCFVSADALVGLAPIDGEPFATRLHRNGFPEDTVVRGEAKPETGVMELAHGLGRVGTHSHHTVV